MNQKVYIDQIFELIITPWINTHHNFMLEEEGNLGHRIEKSNIIWT